MPTKHRKKKPTQKQLKKQKEVQENLWNFHLYFTDITMAETEGKYSAVKKLMDSEVAVGKHEWVCRTRLSIVSAFGDGQMTLNFYHDGRVYVTEYAASSIDVYYIP